MTTPPEIEELVKRLHEYGSDWRIRTGNAKICEEAANALESQAARMKSLEEQCAHRAQHQLRQSQRISDLEAELDLANKQIVETGRAWTADRSALEAQVEAFREALEEAANIAVRVPAKYLGMDKDQRVYSWHDVMDGLTKAMNAIRALMAALKKTEASNA